MKEIEKYSILYGEDVNRKIKRAGVDNMVQQKTNTFLPEALFSRMEFYYSKNGQDIAGEKTSITIFIVIYNNSIIHPSLILS